MASKACIGVGLAMIEMMYPGKYNPANSKKLAGLLHEMFISISDDLFIASLKRCFAVCSFPPAASDIYGKVKEEILQKVSFFEMWTDIFKIIQKLDDYMDKFCYTTIEDDGMLTGTKMKLRCKQYYESLPVYVKQFFGSYSNAMNTTEILEDNMKRSMLQKSFLNYIKSRFDNSTLEELREIIDHFQLYKIDKMFLPTNEREHDFLEVFQNCVKMDSEKPMLDAPKNVAEKSKKTTGTKRSQKSNSTKEDNPKRQKKQKAAKPDCEVVAVVDTVESNVEETAEPVENSAVPAENDASVVSVADKQKYASEGVVRQKRAYHKKSLTDVVDDTKNNNDQPVSDVAENAEIVDFAANEPQNNNGSMLSDMITDDTEKTDVIVDMAEQTVETNTEPVVKKKRGRPKKIKPEETGTVNKTGESDAIPEPSDQTVNQYHYNNVMMTDDIIIY